MLIGMRSLEGVMQIDIVLLLLRTYGVRDYDNATRGVWLGKAWREALNLAISSNDKAIEVQMFNTSVC